jgi:hypothetical protein
MINELGIFRGLQVFEATQSQQLHSAAALIEKSRSIEEAFQHIGPERAKPSNSFRTDADSHP